MIYHLEETPLFGRIPDLLNDILPCIRILFEDPTKVDDRDASANDTAVGFVGSRTEGGT